MICKHDRLDEESEKMNNYFERINDKTSNVLITDYCNQTVATSKALSLPCT